MLPQIRLISRDNGVGLSRDLDLMLDALAGPVQAERIGLGGRGQTRWQLGKLWCRRALQGPVPVQLFGERVYRHFLPLAERNLLVPNPEWFLPRWMPSLSRFDAVLCKTRHAERIFRALGSEVRYVGFTSADRMLTQVQRQRVFLHLAGRSSAKGTQVLIDTWKRHPHWPLLVVVQHPKRVRERVVAHNIDHRVTYLDDTQLQILQNACQFHICPSETEGFGHYLMEGLSVGAVVLATDGEPMDELVSAQRGIPIAVADVRNDGLVRRHFVSAAGIVAAVEQALAMDVAASQRISANARAHYLANSRSFRQRFRSEVHAFMPEMAGIPASGIE